MISRPAARYSVRRMAVLSSTVGSDSPAWSSSRRATSDEFSPNSPNALKAVTRILMRAHFWLRNCCGATQPTLVARPQRAADGPRSAQADDNVQRHYKGPLLPADEP